MRVALAALRTVTLCAGLAASGCSPEPPAHPPAAGTLDVAVSGSVLDISEEMHETGVGEGDAALAARLVLACTVDESLRGPLDPAEWAPVAMVDGLPVATHRELDRTGSKLMRIHTVAIDPARAAEVDHGPDWAYFESGFPARVEHFRRGARHGLVRLWWSTGQVREEGLFEHGQRVGVHRSFSKQGRLVAEGRYHAGARHGLHQAWYPDGQQEEEAHYVRGVQVGEHRRFGRDGRLLLEERYDDTGALQGRFADHYPETGTVRRFGDYEHGLRVGTWRVARPDGQGLLLEERYEGGELHGLQRQWSDAGALVAEVTYDRGQRTGPSRTFYADGAPQSAGRLEAGLRVGRWEYWSPDGAVNTRWTGTYEADVRVGD